MRTLLPGLCGETAVTELEVVLEAIRYIQLLTNKIFHNLTHTQQQELHVINELLNENLQEKLLPVQRAGSPRSHANLQQTVQDRTFYKCSQDS